MYVVIHLCTVGLPHRLEMLMYQGEELAIRAVILLQVPVTGSMSESESERNSSFAFFYFYFISPR